MKIWKKLTSKRLISPLIATLILVGIAIAGGLMVYGLTTGMFGTLGAKGTVSVEAIDLVQDTSGANTFTITVKNSGNKPATEITVKLNGEAPTAMTLPASGILQPGQQAILTLSDADLTQSYVIGNTYTVVVVAMFTDGSTYTMTTSVQCRM